MTHGQSVWPAHREAGASPGRPHSPVLGQARWLHLAEDEIDAAWLRADGRRNALVIARAVGWAADWHTGRSRPTLARLMEVSGLSLRTVQRWTRWLEQRGLLVVVEAGATAEFRPGILRRGDPNLAREWLLAVPAGDSTGTPSGSAVRGTDGPNAREARPGKVKGRYARAPRGLLSVPHPVSFATWGNPQTRSEGLAAAAVVRARVRALWPVSDRHVRHVIRPYLAAGWAPGDVLHAIDCSPGGREHGYVHAVRHPAGWLRYRLSLWLSPAGTPVTPLSQLRAAGHARSLAEQRARRAERQASAERRVDAAAHAARARAMMAERIRARELRA
jgi:hypothetical protein